MKRDTRNQTKHNKMVGYLARKYKRDGFDEVYASQLPDWEEPAEINGYRPDVVAIKLRGDRAPKIVVIEVETPETFKQTYHMKQRQAFKNWARRSGNRSFRVVTTH